jgi:hypothetical protein
MSEIPLTPQEHHRRQLAKFARWLVATLDAPETARDSIVAVARKIDLGSLSKADTLGSLTLLDELLSDVWDKRPDAED